jgi:peroxiredoxin
MTACTKPAPPESKVKPDATRKQAPEFALKDSDGRTVTLADYKGKVVLLNFWATWCGPCKIEIPWFADFEQKYKDRGFAVLGVAMDEEGWEVVKPYLAESKVNYRVILGNDTVAGLYGGVESLPTTFVLDRDGKIASTHVGLVSKSDYENEIMQLLEGAKSSDARSAVVAVNRTTN